MFIIAKEALSVGFLTIIIISLNEQWVCTRALLCLLFASILEDLELNPGLLAPIWLVHHCHTSFFHCELWSTAWCSWSWLFLHLLSLLQKKGETQSMCVFHITRNFKFLRWVQSLCMPCRNSKCWEDRGHDYFVQLYFFDIWQALSVCRLDGRIERGME